MGGLACIGGVAIGLTLTDGSGFRLLEGQPIKVPHVGLLSSELPDAAWHGALWESMRGLGWTECWNLVVDHRYAEDRPDRFAHLAAELVREPVDVLVAEGTPITQAAQQATATIPIVRARSGDPISVGFVACIRRPIELPTAYDLRVDVKPCTCWG
jgi:hypothetical protein